MPTVPQNGSNLYRNKELIVLILLLVSIFSNISTKTYAETREISELAFPLTVSSGDEISFTINTSLHPKYLYAAAPDSSKRIEYWGYRDGIIAWGGKRSDIYVQTMLNPGNWNLSFETSGRISIVNYLPEMCEWTISTTNLDDVRCPSINITETTAFALTTWSLERSYVFKVEGDIDSFFFDEYLRPLGQSSEMVYEDSIKDSVVIVPKSHTSIVNFTLSPNLQSEGGLTVWLILIAVLMAIPVILIVLAKRRKKKEEGPQK